MSVALIVTAENAFGNLLEHFPSFKQGALLFAKAHAPYIIHRLTIACSRGWRIGSGSSAHTIRSYTHGSLGLP